jgi:tetratricopeptide (TPR) repeat protein
MGESAKALPVFGRLAQVSDESASTRYLLWKTGINALRSGAPAILPNDAKDALHSFRPVIGYGPESIWFAVNIYGMPELLTFFASEADRMHNEVYDHLIAVGLAGTLLYLFIFAAAFFCSLRYLDLLGGLPRKIAFTAFLIVGSGAGVLLPWMAGSLHLAGMGIQAGMVFGLFAYIAWAGFGHSGANIPGGDRRIWVICVLSALIAHFIETSVCIAVTPTYTYFFLLLAVLIVLISKRVEENDPAKPRDRKPRSLSGSSLKPVVAISLFIITAEAWCFTVNNTVEHSSLALFLRNWFVPSNGKGIRFPFSDPLILLIVTIVGSMALLYAEKSSARPDTNSFGQTVRVSLGTMGVVWLVIGFLSALFWATLDSSVSSPIDESLHAEARITLLFIGLLLLLIIAAWSFVSADSHRYAAAAAFRASSCWIGFLLAIGALMAILNLTIFPAWADVASHMARGYEASGELAEAMPLYERAAKLAPDVIPYRISQGLARGRTYASNSEALEELSQSFKRALDLNPLDPSTYRTLGSFYLQLGERSPNPTVRDVQIQKAIPCFERAVRLAPNNPKAYSELGRCYVLMGDYAKANAWFEKAMRVYPANASTFLYMGEMYYKQNNLERALKSYYESIDIGGGVEAMKKIGFLSAFMGRRQEAIRMDLEALKIAPNDIQLLRHLSVLYFSLGENASGRDYARRAFDVARPTGTSLETFIAILEDQARQLLEQMK